MIVSLAALLIIIFVVLQRYLKPEPVKSFLAFLSSLVAMTIALNYYELLGKFMLAKGFGGAWAAPGALLLLYLISFAILVVIMGFFLKAPIYFSALVDKLIACGCVAMAALIACGILIIAITMTPIPGKWTYSRYDNESLIIDQPTNAMLPADSITAGLFSAINSGALKTEKNFSTLHPNFLDQIHLNKIGAADGVISMASPDCMVVNKNSAWLPTLDYKNAATGEFIEKDLIFIRLGIKSGTPKDGGVSDENGTIKFTLAQFRLLAADKPLPEEKLSANTQAIHPLGYVQNTGTVAIKPANEIIEISRKDFKKQEGFGNVFLIDLAFEMPKSKTPVAIAFRDFGYAQLDKPIQEDQLSYSTKLIQISKSSMDFVKVSSLTGAAIQPMFLSARGKLFTGLRFSMKGNDFPQSDYEEIGSSDIQDGKIYTANLKMNLDKQNVYKRESLNNNKRTLTAMLAYNNKNNLLIALKCQSPRTGKVYDKSSFPVLIDFNGNEHHAVGLICGGKSNDQFIYQLDYCSLEQDQLPSEIQLNDDNYVTSPFPQEIWITEQLDEVTDLHFIYAINIGDSQNIITAVKVGNKQVAFIDADGLIVK